MVTRAIELPPTPLSISVPGACKHGSDDDHGADRQQDREDAPEGELPPHPAAIDDGIGIERHDSELLKENRARQCGQHM